MREVKRKDKATKKNKIVLIPPIWTGHADYCQPFEFIGFMRQVGHLDFDVMLESKVKDLALLRLRPDMLRYAPDVAAMFGLTPAQAAVLEAEDPDVVEVDADELV